MKVRLCTVASFIAATLAVSCQKNFMDESPEFNENNRITHTVSVGKALSELQSVIDAIGDPTRSGSSLKIQNIQVVRSNDLTRSYADSAEISGEADTLLYVVNFADSSGYAVLGADDRLEPVYVIGDHGSIDAEQFDLNVPVDDTTLLQQYYVPEDDDYLIAGIDPNLKNVLLTTWVDDERAVFDDGGIIGGGGGGNATTTEVGDWVVKNYVATMIRNKWHQRSPFNQFVPDDNGEHHAAGCVALAVSRVMAYCRYPENYCDWDAANCVYTYVANNTGTYTFFNGSFIEQRIVAQLISDVGDGCYTNYDYWGSTGSFSTPEKAKDFMNRIGYTATKHKRYDKSDEQRIYDNLLAGKPVLLSAISGVTGGHMWVIDGMIDRQREIKKVKNGSVESTKTESQLLYHCSWGWRNGKGDGYYISGIFSPYRGAVEFDKTLSENAGNRASTRKYHWHFRSITFDYPKK